jgi:hypothetical protein
MSYLTIGNQRFFKKYLFWGIYSSRNPCIFVNQNTKTMKNNLNVSFNEVVSLNDKPKFLIEDLIKLLSELDPFAEVVFATINDWGVNLSQEENFIFSLRQEDRDDEILGTYKLYVITKERFS